MEAIKLKTECGNRFEEVTQKAKEIATSRNVIVEFDFNGVKCLIDENTNLKWLNRDYCNSWTMNWKSVGPKCVEKYTPEVQAEFKRRKKAENEKHEKEMKAYRLKEERERKAFDKKVSGVKLELKDAVGWQKSVDANKDGYGKAVVDYAEGWAKLMQIEISKGKSLKECANSTQHGLGFLGITGFQYGCVVGILSQCWKYGEELRLWHNKQYGVNEDKKGVVNPAVLKIGV